jgi:uroporphyrin-III C-methyltransferase
MRDVSPKVALVGAGPGDPELITVKGLKAIQEADVILYDALVSPALLAYASAGCKTVYVGKRKGKKEFPQEEINQLMVFYAVRFGYVVRLKGGDPNVFGRGHEELEYIRRREIPVAVISGISSALSAPSMAGIPLTKRGINESFWVITGTVSTGEMSKDIILAAQSTATVIILMGMAHLKKIMELFQRLRSPNEPIALIQDATTPRQKIAIGTVSDIGHCAAEMGLSSPAVMVIGKVVEECDRHNLLATVNSRVIAED